MRVRTTGLMLLAYLVFALERAAAQSPAAASQPAERPDAGSSLGLRAAASEGRRAASPPAAARRPVDAIRDNSFLIEEAFNQEAGVVQHIFTGQLGLKKDSAPNSRTWDLSFTQEWPLFGQTHQISYTIPAAFLSEAGQHEAGFGDVLLNYRCQILDDEGAFPAIAPRISLICPTGHEDRGLGTGVFGLQFNLPISKTLTDRLYVNFNTGFTLLPQADVRLSNGRRSDELDLLSFHVGGSLIYAVSENFNLLLEVAANFDQELTEVVPRSGRRPRAVRGRISDVVISPGARWAINLPGDVQIVPGVALPIGVSDEAMDYGMFLYLSIEHPFLKGESEE